MSKHILSPNELANQQHFVETWDKMSQPEKLWLSLAMNDMMHDINRDELKLTVLNNPHYRAPSNISLSARTIAISRK